MVQPEGVNHPLENTRGAVTRVGLGQTSDQRQRANADIAQQSMGQHFHGMLLNMIIGKQNFHTRFMPASTRAPTPMKQDRHESMVANSVAKKLVSTLHIC